MGWRENGAEIWIGLLASFPYPVDTPFFFVRLVELLQSSMPIAILRACCVLVLICYVFCAPYDSNLKSVRDGKIKIQLGIEAADFGQVSLFHSFQRGSIKFDF